MKPTVQSRSRSQQQGSSRSTASKSQPTRPQSQGQQTPNAETAWADYLGLDEHASAEEGFQPMPVPPPSTSAPSQPPQGSFSQAPLVRRIGDYQRPPPSFSQSLKRKASHDVWPRTAPLRNSKRRPREQQRPADTITINGEVYDRRKRPGSFSQEESGDDGELELQYMPTQQPHYYPEPPYYYAPSFVPEHYAREAFSSYRCPSPSNASVATSLQSPPGCHSRVPSAQPVQGSFVREWDESSSLAPAPSYSGPSGASAVGRLASPTAQMRLASSQAAGQQESATITEEAGSKKRTSKDSQRRQEPAAPPSDAPSNNSHSTASAPPTALPPQSLLPIPHETPTEVGANETTLSGSSEESKPKPKRIRKRPPPKGTPQAAMSSNPDAPVHVARPPNAWILYRSDQLRIIRQDPVISKKPQADISKLVGALWREEKPEVKLWYEQQADIKKSEHLKAHPDYRFAPQKKEGKEVKQRSAPTQNSSKSNISSSSSSNSTIPVPRKPQSATGSTPATTPNSAVSPPQDLSAGSQRSAQLMVSYPVPVDHESIRQNAAFLDELPLHFDFDHPNPFEASSAGSSRYATAPVARFLGQSPRFRSFSRDDSLPLGSRSGSISKAAVRSDAQMGAPHTSTGAEFTCDNVWNDFLAAGEGDQSWFPYTALDFDGASDTDGFSLDRAFSQASWPSSAGKASELVPTPTGEAIPEGQEETSMFLVQPHELETNPSNQAFEREPGSSTQTGEAPSSCKWPYSPAVDSG